MDKFKFNIVSTVFTSLLLVGSASAAVPDCANPATTSLVSQQLAKYIIDAGVPDTNPADLGKAFEIANVRMTARDEQLDAYRCDAEFIVHYPKDLSSLIFASYSSQAGQAELQAKLNKKYGETQGLVVYGQLQSVMTNGLLYLEQQTPGTSGTPEGLKQAIKQILSELFDKPSPEPVRYEIYPVKNGTGGANFSVKWGVDNDGGIDLPFIFYRINAAYR